MTATKELAKLKAHLAGVKKGLQAEIDKHTEEEKKWWEAVKNTTDFSDKNYYSDQSLKHKALAASAKRFMDLLEPPSDG